MYGQQGWSMGGSGGEYRAMPIALLCLWALHCHHTSLYASWQVKTFYDPTVAGLPWGGCQFIANGDINQSSNLNWGNDPAWAGFDNVTYTWDLPMWNEWFDVGIVMTQVYRTSDKDYVLFTQQVGDGNVSDENHAKLMACMGKPFNFSAPDTTIYAWTNRECKEQNTAYLQTLPGPEIVVEAILHIDGDADIICGSKNVEAAHARLRRRLHSDEEVPRFTIKRGASIILTATLDAEIGLYNGARGTLQTFLQPGDPIPEGALVLPNSDYDQASTVWQGTRDYAPVVAWANGILHVAADYTFSEMVYTMQGRKSKLVVSAAIPPLAIGKCSTLNKCIGREEDNVLLLLTSPSTPVNLAYIGLTRMKRGWASLYLTHDFNISSIRMDPRCQELMRRMEEQANSLHVITLRDGRSDRNQYTTRFAMVAKQASLLDTPTVPEALVDDHHNPNIKVKSSMVTLKVNRKMQPFMHVVCKPGYANPAPSSGTFYDMSSLPENWFRDIVRYSTGSTNKNKPAHQLIPVWGTYALVTRRDCAGVLMCEHYNDAEDPCTWATIRRSAPGKGPSADSKLCPVHRCVQSSPKCGAFFQMYEEAEPWGDPENQKFGLLMSDHSHPPWSKSATLHANTKVQIREAITKNSNVTCMQFVTGVSLQGRPAAQGCLIHDDPALSNSALVSRHIRQYRKEFGAVAATNGHIAEVESALQELPGDVYVKSPLSLLRGPMPMVLCASDMQLFYACSPDHFTSQSIDFTFSEVQKPMDCMDNHSTDFEKGMTLALWRIYAIKKSAEATEFYLHNFLKECHRRGLKFIFGVSIVSLIIDFHYGQALGVLRCLITVLGQEEGAEMFLTLLRGCGTHLKTSLSKGIGQSAVEWHSEDLPDVGLTSGTGDDVQDMDQSTWKALSPDRRKNKMKNKAWAHVKVIMGEHSLQEDVDHALGELSRMSPTLKRLTDWMSRPVMKALACPAYSKMDMYVRQAAAPQHDIMSKGFLITDNPAEGCHLRRQAIGKQDPLGVAIVKSYRSDDSDYARYSCAKQGLATLHDRTTEGVKNYNKAKQDWRAANKKSIAADGAIRDGPAFNNKECQNCGVFIPRSEMVCSTCLVPATALGARSVTSNAQPSNSIAMGAGSASAQHAVDLLSNALMAMDPNRRCVIFRT